MLGFGMPPALLHTAQVELDATTASDSLEIHFGRQVAPQGFAWLVPVHRGGRYRMKAGLLVRGDARAHLRRFLASGPVAERVAAAPREPVRRLLPVAAVRRSYGPRVVLVGDAAGLTKPVTGGGIFYGVLSGGLAAETLVEALAADDLGLRRLATYESRWRARLGRELWTGQWFRRVLAALSDAELEAFVRALGSEGARGAIAKTARFNWHRGMIVALLREPGIKSILLRSLFR
jgi:flavin-dependent dehydrogenase